MEKLTTRLANLLCIKSIVTLALTAGFIVLALRGVFSGAEYLAIFTMIVGFYFGTQATKPGGADNAKTE